MLLYAFSLLPFKGSECQMKYQTLPSWLQDFIFFIFIFYFYHKSDRYLVVSLDNDSIQREEKTLKRDKKFKHKMKLKKKNSWLLN